MAAGRVYVVVSGPPGSGKTTLARPLAEELGLPLIAKDRIKESLLDSLGIADLEGSRRVGRATMSLLYVLALDARAAVLESTWSHELAPPALGRLGAPTIEVYCSCPPELAEARYRGRAATRHPGHHDADRQYEERWTTDRPLGIGPLIVVDTTEPVDVGALGEAVRSQAGWPGAGPAPGPYLHNVTVYVDDDRFEEVEAFYRDVMGLDCVFEQPGHICCLDVSGGGGVALCVHEAEARHPSGGRELFFWVADVTPYRQRAAAAGDSTQPGEVAERARELTLVDPLGNLVRLHRRRDEAR